MKERKKRFKKNHSLQGRRIWITGASSGIGEALAIECAQQGATLVLSGRSAERLDNVKQACGEAKVMVCAFDVTSRDETQQVADRIEKELGGLDTVVLNAGTCEYVDLPPFDADLVMRVMNINFNGFVYGVEAALPLLRKGNKPHLVGMSSTVAYLGLPRAEAYGASKAAIRYFLQALSVDLIPQGIDVTILCPGFVKTPLTDLNDFPMPMRLSVERAARIIRRGIERRKSEVSFPFMFALSLRFMAILPNFIKRRILLPLSRSTQ